MHNHVLKIQAIAAEMEAAGTPLPHEFINTEVYHDQWCRFLRGVGECNCNPSVTLHLNETPEQQVATFIRLHGITGDA